jgi:membrane associated rhomboid family serine protease
VTFIYPEDRPTRPAFQFRALTRTIQLIVILAVVYLSQVILALFTDAHWIAQVFGLWSDPLGWKTAYQVFSYGFLHAFEDPLHIVLNALMLYFCGTVVESERGPKTMLTLFGAGVFAGGIAFVAVERLRSSGPSVLVGASAGVFSLLTAAAVIRPRMETFMRIPLWIIATAFVGIELVRFAFSVKQGGSLSPVSFVAHLGGAAIGLGLALRGISDTQLEISWLGQFRERMRRRAADRRAAVRSARARKVDALLEKIHKEGIGALSESERRFLKDASSSLKDGNAA